jgi:hypothetical protein
MISVIQIGYPDRDMCRKRKAWRNIDPDPGHMNIYTKITNPSRVRIVLYTVVQNKKYGK